MKKYVKPFLAIKVALLLLAAILLAACGHTQPTPDLGGALTPADPIGVPDKPKLPEWRYDWPRTCPTQGDCSKAPVDQHSNLFIGFTQQEWVKFLQAQTLEAAYIKDLLVRLQTADKRIAFPDTPKTRELLQIPKSTGDQK